eukprot:scaffold108_cov157-Chaetoceros_neogracile.AAC.3
MSLLGRKIIDKFKAALPRLTLPVPPYGSGKYWEKVYKTLGTNDVYEWGDLTMEDLEIIHYKRRFQDGTRDLYGDSVVARPKSKGFAKGKQANIHSNHGSHTTVHDNSPITMIEEEAFDQAIGVYTTEHGAMYGRDKKECDETKSSILILGCGNSNLGQEIHSYYDNQYTQQQMILQSNSNLETQSEIIQTAKPEMNVNIIQCDISPSVVSSMAQRYAHLPNMFIVHADACSHPKSVDSNSFQHFIKQSQAQNQGQSIDAVVDKGLIDAFFCSNKKLIPRVMMNVHSSLRAGSVFMFFSFSRPEYLLKETITRDNVWQIGNIIGDDDDDDDNNKQDNIESNNESECALGSRLDLWSQVDVCELDRIFMYRFVKSDLKFVEKDGLLEDVNMGKLRAMPSMHKRRKK